MQSRPLKICIIPSKDVSDRAIALSCTLGGLFVLAAQLCAPHLSLYTSEFPDVQEVETSLKSLAKTTKPFPLSATSCELWRDVWLGINYKKDEAIAHFQHAVVERLNPLRKGLLRERDRARLENLSEEEKRNILTFGDRHTGDLFGPHLTLTKFERAVSELPEISLDDYSFTVHELGLFAWGAHGTAIELLDSFTLG